MSTSDQPVRFGSLGELREASDALLHAYHDKTTPEAERAEKVIQFVRTASATGALLDTPRDRREAQSLIDYWISNSYRANRKDVPGREALSRVENQLLHFNEELVKEAVKSGQAYIESIEGERVALMSNFPRWPWEWPAFRAKRIDIARRLLLRLVRLPETDGDAVSGPSRVDRLQSLDDTKAVDQCLSDLQSRDIVTITGTGPDAIVALKYESLITDWPWLADLIKERMSYRKAAVKWAQTGRRSVSFLDWFRQKKFRKYGDLNELEQVYAAETWNKTIRTTAPAGLYLGLYIIFILFFLAYYPNIYQKIIATPANIQQKYSAILGSNQSQSVAADIRWLADYDQDHELKFVGVTLENLDLSKLLAPAANMTLATLDHVSFVGARLQAASFQKARLTFVNFTGAKLNKAGFDGATIKNTIFADATLDRAVFDGATFCDGVDFSNVDVRNASFKSMTFAGSEPPTFRRDFAWWLVDGWSFDQRAMLGKKQMENDPFQRDKAGRVQLDLVPTLKENLENADRNLRQYKDNRNQAIWLADRAWTLAIYGADSPNPEAGGDLANSLDGAAAALAAIGLVKDDTDPENIRIRAAAKDSLGYVLLQRGRRATGDARGSYLQGALKALEEAVGLSNEGEIYFRYAIALDAVDAVGRGDEATKSLRIALVDRSYTPTHELYLLDKLFSPGFRNQIQFLLSPPPAAGGKPPAVIADSHNDPCR